MTLIVFVKSCNGIHIEVFLLQKTKIVPKDLGRPWTPLRGSQNPLPNSPSIIDYLIHSQIPNSR